MFQQLQSSLNIEATGFNECELRLKLSEAKMGVSKLKLWNCALFITSESEV